jgi:hypothetical protein
VLCNGCSICFARGSDELDEDLCIKCSKAIDGWDNAPLVRRSPAQLRVAAALHNSEESGRGTAISGAVSPRSDANDDESIDGWCSWCVEDTKHELVSRSLLTRNTYRCTECEHRTLCCVQCEDGMSRSGIGWDDKLCVSCVLKNETLSSAPLSRKSSSAGGLQSWDWLHLKEKKDAVFDPARYTHQRVMTLLALSSPFKERAIAEVFHLLVCCFVLFVHEN